jgi:hypothetical protein
MRTLILYAYFETPDAARNLSFFCRHGISPYRDRQHVVIINGACSIENQIPRFENVLILRRPNTGFDFGAWAHALRSLPIEQFDYFFFLNSSVTGPFMPAYQDSACWPEVFTSRLDDKIKLTGITINVYGGDPIVQSMFLATDRVGLELLIRHKIFTGNDTDATKEAVIFGREIPSSKIILDAGFSVDCLASSHGGRSMPLLRRDALGDIIQPGYYFGGTIEPFDICFFKTNRGCSPQALERAMRIADHKRGTAADRCLQDVRVRRVLDVLRSVPSAWTAHLEFAAWLTSRLLPQIVVDLGVDYGCSTYAWASSGVSQVIGVDWFRGDEQTGIRDTEAEALALGARLVRDFQLKDTVGVRRSSFDEAAKIFDRRVDVLHIDGLHALKAVRRDLADWLPKMSDDGLIVMHGTRAFPQSVGKIFHGLPHHKMQIDVSAGLGIASMDAQKIAIVENEWRAQLYQDASGLRHRWFDGVCIKHEHTWFDHA